MSITRTPNYNLAKPAPKTEKNVWGPPLNENWDLVDQALLDLQSQIDSISVVGSSVYVAQSVSEIQGLTTLTFPGIAINLISWNLGARQGGGMFLLNASDITSVDDGGTILVDLSSRRWYRVFEGSVTPSMFGAINGNTQPDQIAAFTRMHNYINVNLTCHGADVTGNWNVSGGLATVTRNSFRYSASGHSKFNRLSDGKMLSFTGNDVIIEHIEIDGGGFSGTPINISGSRNYVLFCEMYNTVGHGMLFTEGSDSAMVFFNKVSLVGSGGIGLGSAAHSVAGFNVIHDSDAEGIQGNLMEKSIVIGNVGYRCGGIGFLGMDKAIDVAFVGNLGYDSNHNGISCGDNRGGTSWATYAGNVLVDNDHYGIDIKMKYIRWNVTGISKANPCVITFQSISITGATNANPCVITAIAHGKEDGDRVRINGVVGMTQLNGNIYRIDKLTVNTFSLYNEDTYLPINSTAFGVYSSAGKVDHPFSVDDHVVTTGVVGMTEINNLETFVGASTNTTISLQNFDQTANLDSTSFTPYVSGGVSVKGGAAQYISVSANVIRGNNDGAIHVGSAQPVSNQASHIFSANQAFPVSNNFGPFVSDNLTLGRSEDFEAHVSNPTTNVTGNGTAYTVKFNQDSDDGNHYEPSTGYYSTSHAGRYFFQTTVGIQGSGGATSAIIDVIFRDWSGALLQTIREYMVPVGGNPVNATWYGTVSIPTIYLDGLSTVHVEITVMGLGTDRANLIADTTTNFRGGLRA